MTLLCAVCILCGTTTYAQDNTGSTRPMWGVRAAFDINIPGKWHYDGGSVNMFNHGYGFTIGTVYNVYLGRNFYLEPGISFFYDTYKYDIEVLNDGTVYGKNPDCYKLGFRVPVVAGYAFNINDRMSMTVFTGPELNIALKGRAKVPDIQDKETGWDLFGEGGQHRFDLAWNVGVGFPIGNFLVSVDGSIGITDLQSGDVSFRENRASVGLTYYF